MGHEAVELLAARLIGTDWARAYPLEAGPAVFRRSVTDPRDVIKAVLTPVS
jgi:hypothetical protein